MIPIGSVKQRAQRLQKRKSIDFLPIAVDLLVIWDVIAGLISGEMTLFVYYKVQFGHAPDTATIGAFWREIILSSLFAGVVLREPRLATDRTLFVPGRLLALMGPRGAAVLALMLVIGLATRAMDDLARAWLLSWSVLFGCCVALSRIGFVFHVRRLLGCGALREAIAIVRMAGHGDELANQLAAEADVVLSIEVGDDEAAGLSDEDDPTSLDFLDRPAEQILSLGRSGAIDSVVVALPQGENATLVAIIDQLKCLPVEIIVCPGASCSLAGPERARLFGGIAMAVVANRPLRAWNLLAKLFLDKVLSAILLVLAAPIMLVIAAAIAVESPGPIFFCQHRTGWGGRSFVLFKFRTMHAVHSGPARQTMRRDPRCTRVGRLLRRTSLDELPQLLNVLLGDMSLVGPRPHVDTLHAAEIVSHALIAEYAQRYRVKPGMTGWAQVNGYRGAVTTAEQLRRRVEHDLFYIENWSLLFDIRILLRTPLTILSGENAF